MKQKYFIGRDLALLLVFPLIAFFLVYFFKLGYLCSILLFYGLPAIWLSIREPKTILKSSVFAVIFSIPFVVVVNYLGVANGSWYVPSTVFPFRYLVHLPIEDVLLGLFMTYSIVASYEYFFDKGKNKAVDKNMKYLIGFCVVSLVCFFFILAHNPLLLHISYFYIWLGLILVLIPCIAILFLFPRLLSKCAKVTGYFFYVTALFEIDGVALNHWNFPGHEFVGWIPYFGHRIPIEEFIFYIVLIPFAILCYYELFDDDER